MSGSLSPLVSDQYGGRDEARPRRPIRPSLAFPRLRSDLRAGFIAQAGPVPHPCAGRGARGRRRFGVARGSGRSAEATVGGAVGGSIGRGGSERLERTHLAWCLSALGSLMRTMHLAWCLSALGSLMRTMHLAWCLSALGSLMRTMHLAWCLSALGSLMRTMHLAWCLSALGSLMRTVRPMRRREYSACGASRTLGAIRRTGPHGPGGFAGA